MRIHEFFLRPMLGSFLAGVAILIYAAMSGPGWQFFRFYMGDVVAVMFLFFLLSLFWWGPTYLRVAAIGSIAVAIEFAQLFELTPKHGNFLTQIVLGSHFELWDLVAYGVGLTLAVAMEWRFLKQDR